jgi:hypothetical protein
VVFGDKACRSIPARFARACSRSCVWAASNWLPTRADALPSIGSRRLQLFVIVRRTHVLDIAGTPPGGGHDLDRRAPDAVFSLRTYATAKDYEH